MVYFGAIVPSGIQTANGRLVGRDVIDLVIPVAGDTYIFTFGSIETTANILQSGATQKIETFPHGAIGIAPGWSFQLDLWGTSNAAAAAYEVEMVYVER